MGTIRGAARRRQRGFTLLELMIVMSVIVILMTVAIPNYQRSMVQARETVLRNNLFTLRSVIDQYTLDKQKAPQSLQDLVSAGYLRELPRDPMTNSSETWQVVQEDTLAAIDQTQPGIVDVHSGADGTASDGTAYSSW
ncbi:MAG TPA: prepilin-type N-terminal cleavage/methylation domain-containing protein [Clostridia bacterium]|nr:prepilin-type N-terminal cleavage/methylation domain-containing protein [Clostridia bacterium]